MTDPNSQQQQQQTNAQPPHTDTHTPPQQQPRPVIVPSVDSAAVTQRLDEFGRTLAGLPETLVSAFREATQPAQHQQQQPAPNQGGNQQQAPGSTPPPPPNTNDHVAQGTGSDTGKPEGFRAKLQRAWFGKP